jgi:replicative DNA helicase
MNLDHPRYDRVPKALTELDNWVLWRNEGGTKVPYAVGGYKASSTKPQDWATFVAAFYNFENGDCKGNCFDGLGFVFREGGGLVGIDLDGCRDPESGAVSDWATKIIRTAGSYAEVSPSKTGVKIFLLGSSPFNGGRKFTLNDEPTVGGKQPAIEVYDRGRYFAVTGWRLRGYDQVVPAIEWPIQPPAEDQPTFAPQFPTDWATVSVLDRARLYLAKCPPSISGAGGHNALFYAACRMCNDFALDDGEALALLQEWNLGCQPPWAERDIAHKIRQARKQQGERGRLRDAKQEEWAAFCKENIPELLTGPTTKTTTTLVQSSRDYLESLKTGGGDNLLKLGLPELDEALGGGVARGEMVVVGARPSHGKSMVALQWVHNWTALGHKVLVVSEEMTRLQLGKRTLQFASQACAGRDSTWLGNIEQIEADLDAFAADRADAIVVNDCRNTAAVEAEVERAVQEHDITAVVVDYAQLVDGPGKNRYEQVSATSIALKRLGLRHNLVMVVLVQLNREVEKRESFKPTAKDLRDSGQFEQDADTIVCLCYPFIMDNSRQENEFVFYICKNKNRGFTKSVIQCYFEPERQRVGRTPVEKMANYEPAFESWNDREPIF